MIKNSTWEGNLSRYKPAMRDHAEIKRTYDEYLSKYLDDEDWECIDIELTQKERQELQAIKAAKATGGNLERN